ncbi:hypothetical protein F0U59_26735 [Archangium gephyra]|nr:hypothetical protein F0U59_26735 [Archangium gephyra]
MMKPLGSPEPVVTATGPLIGRVVRWVLTTPAVGFQVLPAPGNLYKYPVTVVVNPNESNAETIIVTGPYDYRPARLGVVRELLLQLGHRADAVNGGKFDRWELLVAEVADDAVRNHLRTSRDGYTAVRPAGAVPLFSQEYSGASGEQVAAFTEMYLCPPDETSSVNGGVVLLPDSVATLPWHVGDFRGGRFVVEASVAHSGTVFTPFVELYARDERVITREVDALYKPERIQLNNLGSAGTVRVTSLLLGAGATVTEGAAGEFKATTRWAPYLRFGLSCNLPFPFYPPAPLGPTRKFRFSFTAW